VGSFNLDGYNDAKSSWINLVFTGGREMFKLIFSTVFLFVPLIAFSQLSRSYSHEVLKIDRYCKTEHSVEYDVFLQGTSLLFLDVLQNKYNTGEFAKYDFSHTQNMSKFCIENLGKEYGYIQFKSTPAGAKIYVDSDEQNDPTPTTKGFHPANYEYEIRLKSYETCSGSTLVKAKKTSKVNCTLKKSMRKVTK